MDIKEQNKTNNVQTQFSAVANVKANCVCTHRYALAEQTNNTTNRLEK